MDAGPAAVVVVGACRALRYCRLGKIEAVQWLTKSRRKRASSSQPIMAGLSHGWLDDDAWGGYINTDLDGIDTS